MEREEIIKLYDIYGKLLTDKQQEYVEEYYYMDLSLSEIADNHNISRNGVYDQINKATSLLEEYETKLHLCEKYKKISDLALDDDAKAKIEDIIWGED